MAFTFMARMNVQRVIKDNNNFMSCAIKEFCISAVSFTRTKLNVLGIYGLNRKVIRVYKAPS